MRSTLRLAFVVCLTGVSAIAAPQLKDQPNADRPSVIGVWTQDAGGSRNVFTEDGILLVGDSPKFKPQPPRYVVNTKTNPMEFDLTHTDLKATWLGICKVEGDTLTICISTRAGDPRPTKFERSERTLISLTTYTRVKTKD